jgi:hypothetical protein
MKGRPDLAFIPRKTAIVAQDVPTARWWFRRPAAGECDGIEALYQANRIRNSLL